MRFLVDECAGPAIADWLRGREHDIYSVYNQSPGISDDDILKKAVKEHRILITCDKDFGEKRNKPPSIPTFLQMGEGCLF
jgi:predicted nuclease of predicted toxin-antitoxin system